MEDKFKKMVLDTLAYAKDVLKYNETQMPFLKFLETWENEKGVQFWYNQIVVKKVMIAEGWHERAQDNICAYDRAYRLAFCDLGGFMSGEVMKYIGDVNYRAIEELKKKLIGAKIGDIFIIENNVFVVVRKHYANKVTATTIAPMIPAIQRATEGLELKCYKGDFPQFFDEVSKLTNVSWRSKCIRML